MKKRLYPRPISRLLPFPGLSGSAGTFFLVLIALSSFIFTSLNPQSVYGLRTGFYDLLAPVLTSISKPVQDAALFVRNISGLAHMQEENAALKTENARLRAWYQTALLLEAENKSLHSLLNASWDNRNDFVTARIFSDSGSKFVKSLLIDVGLAQNVEKGQAVSTEMGLIGRVTETGQQVSRVLLITDINSRVPVLVESSQQHAILAGDNNHLPRLLHLSPDAQLQEGERVVTSGYGGMFPAGVPIGRVMADDNGQLRVMLFSDLSRTVHVRVAKGPGTPYLQKLDAD